MIVDEINNELLRMGEHGFVDVELIGYSELGQPIYSAHVGSFDGKQFIIEGAIHAREYVTSYLLLELIRYYRNKDLDFGIYFVPLVNPDGARLVLEGAGWIEAPAKREFLIGINGGSEDFSLWKANANAVDLNVNFDADWGGGDQNVRYPAPANFIGYYPNSESEVQTLIGLTEKVKPDLTLSYHTRGEIIFYGFKSLTFDELLRDLSIARDLSATTGYEPVRSVGSSGGYQDYISLNYNVPAYTMEVGSVTWPHPIGVEYLPTMFMQNKDVPVVAYNGLLKTEADGFLVDNLKR